MSCISSTVSGKVCAGCRGTRRAFASSARMAETCFCAISVSCLVRTRARPQLAQSPVRSPQLEPHLAATAEGCIKSYHLRCCNLKRVPEGLWECPRHRCINCGSGPSQTDSHGSQRQPDILEGDLRPCRTCPVTYCNLCLPPTSVATDDGDEVRACAFQSNVCQTHTCV